MDGGDSTYLGYWNGRGSKYGNAVTAETLPREISQIYFIFLHISYYVLLSIGVSKLHIAYIQDRIVCIIKAYKP